ncbi:class I SAM-dependent methyltransferase, partial [bacterium]|nr:class I SAM-dependent methyltransferase [bacterium]
MDKHLKKVIAHHDWWSETYDSSYFDHFELYHRITLMNLLEYLPEDKNAAILDAGGGTGIWSIELAKLDYQNIILTDIAEKMLEKVGIKIAELGFDDKIIIRTSNICDMPEFEDEIFDFVLCEGDPLSYCGDHQKAIKELVRVSKPKGRIFASVDNRISVVSWLDKDEDPEMIDQVLTTGDVQMPIERNEFRYFIHAFTSQELRELFESNGLFVERIIGKPVIANRFKWTRSKDPKFIEQILKLEFKY